MGVRVSPTLTLPRAPMLSFGMRSSHVLCLLRYVTLDSKQLEHGCRMIYADFPSFSGLRLEDGHVAGFYGTVAARVCLPSQ